MVLIFSSVVLSCSISFCAVFSWASSSDRSTGRIGLNSSEYSYNAWRRVFVAHLYFTRNVFQDIPFLRSSAAAATCSGVSLRGLAIGYIFRYFCVYLIYFNMTLRFLTNRCPQKLIKTCRKDYRHTAKSIGFSYFRCSDQKSAAV